MVEGWKFRVRWRSTQLVQTINATSLEIAERKIRRKYRKAEKYEFVGKTSPVTSEPRYFPDRKKVF